MKSVVAVAAFYCAQSLCIAAAPSPFPRLLPPAEEFRLTLSEESNSDLPLGDSCGDVASLTLLCRSFVLTLQNTSSQTVRISEIRCIEPNIIFELKQPKSSSGWWPISQPGKPTCDTLDWINIQLKPGEKTQYATRLISPRRWFNPVGEGKFTLHAAWTLIGCTEKPDGKDCLTPLQILKPGSSVPDIDIQEPVSVMSNEIQAESPHLPDLGKLDFSFDVTVAQQSFSDVGGGCTRPNSVDCTTFQYSVRNLGDRAIRNGTLSCSDPGITPEYKIDGGNWQTLSSRNWDCSMNVFIETPILPRQIVTGTFRLSTVAPGYDVTALRQPGNYSLRFIWTANACIASPDGSFCLTRPESQPKRVSTQIDFKSKPSS